MKIEIIMKNVPFMTIEEQLIHIDNKLNKLLSDRYQAPKICIKRTDTPNIVSIGDFSTKSEEKSILSLNNPIDYAKTLLNLTFGKYYTLNKV